jgi:hypothetical protein
MTGAQTEPVSIPQHVTASAVLLRLASPIFSAAMNINNPNRPIAYGVWLTLRETACYFLEREALQLTPKENQLLRDALTFVQRGPDLDYLRSLQIEERAA